MRFLLDTNILIPLEDSQIALVPSLARIVRLSQEHGHQLVYHPASEEDIRRDTNAERRARTMERLQQYVKLDQGLPCPWNNISTGSHDVADNEILYALECDAAHALITEDRGIHDKAKHRGLLDRVYTIQTAEDLLRRLHEATYVRLPSIEDVPLHSLTPLLQEPFFDSLREAYDGFDEWFKERSRRGRRAWVYWDTDKRLGALCAYAHQDNERINDDGLVLGGTALKLATFKVRADCQGRKIGELFLKAAFRYASSNGLQNIFVHGHLEKQHFLFQLLEDFGFEDVGSWKGDRVFLKTHPLTAPAPSLPPFEYMRKFYPHFRADKEVRKFLVPIRPEFHRILFPDYESPADKQLELFRPSNTAGNAIKLAYLSHAQVKQMRPGDVVLFYRSGDERAVTSVGVVEQYSSLSDPDEIARRVSRRTVYSMDDIALMAKKSTKVMLFRLIRHFVHPIGYQWFAAHGIANGNIQSIREISHEAFDRIIQQGS